VRIDRRPAPPDQESPDVRAEISATWLMDGHHVVALSLQALHEQRSL